MPDFIIHFEHPGQHRSTVRVTTEDIFAAVQAARAMTAQEPSTAFTVEPVRTWPLYRYLALYAGLMGCVGAVALESMPLLAVSAAVLLVSQWGD